MTPPDEVIGRSVHERLPPHVAEAILAAGRRAVDEQEVQRIEYSMELRGGGARLRGPCRRVRPRRVRAHRPRLHRTDAPGARPPARARLQPRGRPLDAELPRARRRRGHAPGREPRARAGGRDPRGVVARPPLLEAVHRRGGRRAGAGRTSCGCATATLPGVVEYEHVGPDGERLVVDWTATIVHDAEGTLRYLLCGLDVTARKQVEEEIRRSRARIVSAGDAERKRLERNLHDGAQQNLVTVTHSIHLAARSLRTDPGKAEEHLERALVELTTAHEELRELARGLHPQILSLQGLGPAVRALAGRAPISVTVITVDDITAVASARRERGLLRGRRVAHEHAQVRAGDLGDRPRRPTRRRARGRGDDDGCGGASPADGSGLGGLRDRVEALDGTFDVHSPRGAGHADPRRAASRDRSLSPAPRPQTVPA